MGFDVYVNGITVNSFGSYLDAYAYAGNIILLKTNVVWNPETDTVTYQSWQGTITPMTQDSWLMIP